MGTPFEDFVNRELPRRPVMLTFAVTAYDGDPNAGGAPAIVSGAPAGSFFLQQTGEVLWRKKNASAGSYEVVGGGGGAIAEIELQSAVTLAVSTTGNDTDPARPSRITSGDWSANPFATPQAALDSLPKLGAVLTGPSTTIDATINIAAGTYPGFALINNHLRINIQGARQVFTPATGPSSGTATSGGGRTLTLTGAGWTVNNLIGKMLSVTAGPGAGQVIPIDSNTADTIIPAGRASPIFGIGSVFSIEESSVKLNTNPTGHSSRIAYIGSKGRLRVQDVEAVSGSSTGMFATQVDSFRLDRCVVFGSTTGVSATQTSSATFKSCVATGTSSSAYLTQNTIYFSPLTCLALNSAVGFNSSNGAWLYLATGGSARNCTKGFNAEGGTLHQLVEELWTEGCQKGIYAEQASLELQDCLFNNCTVRTFDLHNTTIRVVGTLGGTGNAGFGVNASGSHNAIELAGTVPTISGTSGQVTVDGVNDVTWANFTVVGDYAADENSGSRVTFATAY